MKKMYICSFGVFISGRLFRRLHFPVSFLGVLFPAPFSGIFISRRFCFRHLYFPVSLFFGLGVSGCLWRPTAAPHNRISIKDYQRTGPGQQPARLSVFLAACRLLFPYVFSSASLFSASFVGVFIFRRLFPASLFSGVLSGVFILRRLFSRRLYFPASFISNVG